MKTKSIIVSLLQVIPLSVIKQSQNEEFDSRSDLLIDGDTAGLAVMAHVTSERHIDNRYAPGIRRRINVCLIDMTTGANIASADIKVSIPSGRQSDFFSGRLDLNRNDIDCRHKYKLIVRECAGVTLHEKQIRFFDRHESDVDSSDWYRITEGSVIDYLDYSYRSVRGEDLYCYKVRFKMESRIDRPMSGLPEVELRIVYPDGSIEARFCQPVSDDFVPGAYYVEMPFVMYGNRKGICYAELLLMDFAIAGFVFRTDGMDEEGSWTGRELYIVDDYSFADITGRYRGLTGGDDDVDNEPTADDDEFETAMQNFIDTACGTSVEDKPDGEEQDISQADCLSALDLLTGLDGVKAKLRMYESIVMFNKLRAAHDLCVTDQPLHAMFLGSPGTGKSTVAKLMGEMLRNAGVLSKGHVVVKERANLIGEFYGSPETNTMKAIEESEGGILLVDEAYQLYQSDDARDPGKHVINSLLSALSDSSRRDWMLILAGYPDRMYRMFEMNPGLKSRIPEANIYMFEDFSEDQLMDIACRYLERNGFTLNHEAYSALKTRLACDYAQRDETFGNARHVVNLIQTEILPAMAERVIRLGVEADYTLLSEIQASDIPDAINQVTIVRPKLGFCA